MTPEEKLAAELAAFKAEVAAEDPDDLWAGFDAVPVRPTVVMVPAQRPSPEQQAGIVAERLDRLRRHMLVRSQLDNVPPPAWMIDGVLSDGALSLLSGKFGTYKTFVALGWACSIATGQPWFGHPVKRDGPVLYVAAEGSRGVNARIRAWERHHLGGAPIPDDRLRIVDVPLQLNHPGDIEAVCVVADELHPSLVVWDTLHRNAPGVEENSNTEMGTIVHHLAQIRDRSACTQLILHHTGHAGVRSRGASNIEDDFEDSWVIQLGGDGEDRSLNNPRTLRHRKAKDFSLSEEIGLMLVVDDDGAARVEMRTQEAEAESEEWIVRRQIMAALDAAHVPLDAGRPAVAAAVRAAGIQIRNADLAEIVRERKSTPLGPALPFEEGP